MLKNKTALSLSPLALLTLAACGSSGTTTTGKTNAGKVSNGPLQDALAYLEYGAVGAADYGNYTAGVDVIGAAGAGMTSSTGAYSIVAKAGTADYTLMADTTDQTMDTVSGVAYGAGVTLKAPVGATAINPATTLVAGIMEDPTNSALTADEAATKVAAALGFSGVNFLTYDPYADQTNMTTVQKQQALDVQLTANKVMTIVKTLAAAGVESGMTASAAATAAMDGIVDIVQTKVNNITADVGGASKTAAQQALLVLDFDVAADLAAINTSVQAEVLVLSQALVAGGGVALNTAAFNKSADSAQTAITNVIAQIETITLLNKDVEGASLRDVLQSINLLVADLKAEAEAVNLNLAYTPVLDFTTAGNILTSMSNPAPTDLKLSGSTTTDATYSASSAETVSVAEGGSTLVVGTVTAIDKGVGTSDGAATPTWTYAADTATFAIVAGGDGAFFNINASTGVLSFKAAPDYETKSSYSVSVQVTDGASKSYIETFTVAIEDVAESGAFGISSDIVTFTDYDVTTSTSVNNQVATTTSGTNVTFGDVVPLQLNSKNMTNLTDGNTLTIGATPVLKFTLDTVPIGTGNATITATITDGTVTLGSVAVAAVAGTPAVAAVDDVWSTDGTRSGIEDQISVTVNVQYTGDGTVASITAAAATATGTYNKGDGTSATFNINNMDTDSFSITPSNAVTGQPASLDVKMSALYDAFVSGAGNANMIVDGEYHLSIATTLPLENAANETVTTFSGKVALSDETSMSTVIGTNSADTLVGTAAAEIFALGYDTDTVTTGGGADLIVLSSLEGRQLANIDTVTDFSNGDTKFLMANFEFIDLKIEAAADSADTLVSLKINGSNPTGNGEYLMLISDVASGFINGGDFISDIA